MLCSLGAKLFYLSNLVNEDYLENDIRNLCRYVLVQKLRALSWRVSHGYILADRYAACRIYFSNIFVEYLLYNVIFQCKCNS